MKSPWRGEFHSQSPFSLVEMLGKSPGSRVSIPLLQPPGRSLHPELPFTGQVQLQHLQMGSKQALMACGAIIHSFLTQAFTSFTSFLPFFHFLPSLLQRNAFFSRPCICQGILCFSIPQTLLQSFLPRFISFSVMSLGFHLY